MRGGVPRFVCRGGGGTNVLRAGPVPVGGLPAPALAVSASMGRLVWDPACGTVARPDEED